MRLPFLDIAQHLPELSFGPNRIAKLAAEELEGLIDTARLKRFNPNWVFDTARFSEFTWLIIEEKYPLDKGPVERANPLLFMRLDADFGRIEPHQQRFSTAVENALFFTSLAPWEDWVSYPDVDWRGFRVPWVYEFNDDLFVRPLPPPSPESLSWEPDVVHDQDGEVLYEGEKPLSYPNNDSVVTISIG